MAMAQKRHMESATPPAKTRRSDDLEDGGVDGDSWTCSKCNNLNYGSRIVCNMRNCGAPRDDVPWICPGCGNENRATRVFCNMRKCQMARPGLTAPALRQAQLQAEREGMNVGGVPGQPDPKLAEPGAWRCVCGNMNYAGRAVCNSRKCGKPAPANALAAAARGGAVFAAAPAGVYGTPAAFQGYSTNAANASISAILAAQQRFGGVPSQAPGQVPVGRVAAAQQPIPEGSWRCSACGNVNFPTRTSCNAKNCGQPRSLVDGGSVQAGPPRVSAPAPAPRGQQQQQTPPEGSWVCRHCSNVNWPTRTSCNRRACGQPRD
eukprot:TRINITY_DN1556_c0_g1_i1.p2 TRINITY_DN1556_c0_g1~~TRINITY_DN1556_c0_g1_i1.p2  ORF type:complete len:355 (-),score=63.45 TRINITY_DN1556_c0_g1_i1:122-1078(-)